MELGLDEGLHTRTLRLLGCGRTSTVGRCPGSVWWEIVGPGAACEMLPIPLPV